MLKQGLFQKLQQKLSPQQIQLMKLLQVPTAELEQRIKQEIEENPALEEGEDGADEEMPTEEQAIAENEDGGGEGEDQGADDRDEIDLSDYFPDDDTPDYKLQANNRSADDEGDDDPGNATRADLRAEHGGEHRERHADHAEQVAATRGLGVGEAAQAEDEEDGGADIRDSGHA